LAGLERGGSLLGGKKHVGELAPFDLVILLVLSETIQNALIGEDKSLIGGLISAATLVLIGRAVGFVSWRSKKAERFFEGSPKVLIRHGRVCRQTMANERITRSELIESLRREGCTAVTNVRFAVLENNGSITVGLKGRMRQPAADEATLSVRRGSED
jgi:uncharacterized membrane protein YcaP (DUF421 family)